MSRPRKVAINATIIGDRPTGLGRFAIEVIRSLAALGEELVVHTSRPEAISIPGVDVRSVSAAVRPEHGARGHIARLLWTQANLRARLRREPTDAVLSLMPEGMVRPPVPQIVTVLDVLPLDYPQEYPRQQFYFRRLVPLILGHCRSVVTISETTRTAVVERYNVPPERVHTALCGYDARRFHAGVPPASLGAAYALYVGNIMPHKNVVRIVDAFAAAARGDEVLMIRGWGRGQHVEALRRRILELGLGQRVDWQPYASEEQLPSLYRGARVVLLPSLAEGFGLPALEAMACGTPVITSDGSSLPEVVGDAALLVDPLDVGALGSALRRIFTDDRLAKELSERGLVRAQQFSWARTGRAIQRALDAALAANGR
jgi:glycosyltransferase involved in cell wall biosynthesis